VILLAATNSIFGELPRKQFCSVAQFNRIWKSFS